VTDTYCEPGTVPKSIPRGKVLCHNHVAHTKRTRSGTKGFRGWFADKAPKDFEPCSCGWSGLPHVAHFTARKP
jgi:hypothetical protein